MKMIFNYHANKTHFHNKGFALSLVLKVRFFGTRKWPIYIKEPRSMTSLTFFHADINQLEVEDSFQLASDWIKVKRGHTFGLLSVNIPL